jgi:hypothetical protein
LIRRGFVCRSGECKDYVRGIRTGESNVDAHWDMNSMQYCGALAATSSLSENANDNGLGGMVMLSEARTGNEHGSWKDSTS